MAILLVVLLLLWVVFYYVTLPVEDEHPGPLPDETFRQFTEPFTDEDERRFFEEWVRS